MILYNVTVNLETSIHPEWLDWVQNHYLPKLMKTGAFSACKLCRLLDSPNDGFTYSIQCLCDSMPALKRYQEEHREQFNSMHANRFPDQFVSFESTMEIIEEYSVSNFSLN